ncbi:MAG: AMP-binding protein [Muribaculaceae bacterium]|nr:AMP-binding protein [Muribaculaceae bacterium]
MTQSLVMDLAESFRRNQSVDALSDLNGEAITYAELTRRVARMHVLLRHAGIKRGDKIALCAKNSSHWALVFLSALTYGAVTVPILNEFRNDSIQHLVSHSDARLFFVDPAIWKSLDASQMPDVDGFVDIETWRLRLSRSTSVKTAFDELDRLVDMDFPEGITAENFDRDYFRDGKDDLAVINYTSGSTGLSKGVMISYGNLWSNARYSTDNIKFFEPGDGMVSMLPLAHMFGLLVELVFPLLKGCHITFLGKVPSPKILLDAFSRIKPKLVVTVPLVIEKIVTNKIFPALRSPLMRVATRIPLLNDVIYRKVRGKMIDAFGGNLHQLIIGGAALAPSVEKFLLRIKFPYTVGYGMTECAPLISYCFWDRQKPGSCGLVVDRMQARVESPDPSTVPGVLWVKGDNVMQGYYKNQEATDAVFDDGWMNTGDICILDNDGYLFIKGRDKSMILGPSGQNIYPEEIENKLNHLPFVAESIVVERDGRLVALVYPDEEAARHAHLPKEKIDSLMDYNLVTLNRELPGYSKVSSIELREEPFEKTPKQSIKRYLYK